MTGKSPFFSVIVPVYNREERIRDTVQSLLQQSYDHFEVIVVDDGSTDRTPETVKGIDHPQLSYYRIPNQERAAARNYGAQQARGDYFNFFDSDDRALSHHLRQAAEAIQAYDNPGVFHVGYKITTEEGELLKKVKTLPSPLNEALLTGNLLSCNGVFLRQDIAHRHPFQEDRALSGSEDWELWLRLAARYPIRHWEAVTSTIIQHQERSVLATSPTALIKRKRTMLQYLRADAPFMNKYGKWYSRLQADTFSYIALHLALLQAERRTVFGYLWKALRKRPSVICQRRFWATLKHCW